jgi:hypothetical protein
MGFASVFWVTLGTLAMAGPINIVVVGLGRMGSVHALHVRELAQKSARREPLARRTFPTRQYAEALPEFVDRFGPAYEAELAALVGCCGAGAPFPTTHNDGRAQQVISVGMRAVVTAEQAGVV